MNNINFNLKINQDGCVRCGSCTVTHPEIFEFDDNGDIQVKQNVERGRIDEVKEACPLGAIIENDN